jgi:hypothetical protein
MSDRDYVIKSIRKENGDIQFFLYGIVLHVDDMFLCTNYIEEKLSPEFFDYKYDWFDTYEAGVFIKDGIKVKINWTIYTDYDFTIDKYSTREEIDKVRLWTQEIFEYLMTHEKVEKKVVQVDLSANHEIDVILKRPIFLTMIKNLKRLYGKN